MRQSPPAGTETEGSGKAPGEGRLLPLGGTFGDLWEHAPFAMALYDTSPEHRCLQHNPAFRTLLGAQFQQGASFVGTPVRHGFDPAFADGIAAIFDRVQTTGQPFTVEEFSISLPPGAPPRYFKGSLAPLRQDGEVVALLMMTVEITEAVRARLAAERDQRRAAILAEASHAFTEASLDFHIILHTVARQVASAFDDLCIVRLVSDDERRLQPLVVAHPNPSVRVAVREQLAYDPGGALEAAHNDVLRSGRPLLQPELNQPWGDLVICGLIVVPLRANGRTMGTLALMCIESGRRYDDEDLALLQDLSARASLAVDNARMLQRVIDSELRLRQTVRQLAVGEGIPANPLTPREQEVLRLVARGRTNAEIAARLRISPATVKRHVEHILRKLGAAGRAEAVAIAASLGLLIPDH